MQQRKHFYFFCLVRKVLISLPWLLLKPLNLSDSPKSSLLSLSKFKHDTTWCEIYFFPICFSSSHNQKNPKFFLALLLISQPINQLVENIRLKLKTRNFHTWQMKSVNHSRFQFLPKTITHLFMVVLVLFA